MNPYTKARGHSGEGECFMGLAYLYPRRSSQHYLQPNVPPPSSPSPPVALSAESKLQQRHPSRSVPYHPYPTQTHLLMPQSTPSEFAKTRPRRHYKILSSSPARSSPPKDIAVRCGEDARGQREGGWDPGRGVRGGAVGGDGREGRGFWSGSSVRWGAVRGRIVLKVYEYVAGVLGRGVWRGGCCSMMVPCGFLSSKEMSHVCCGLFFHWPVANVIIARRDLDSYLHRYQDYRFDKPG